MNEDLMLQAKVARWTTVQRPSIASFVAVLAVAGSFGWSRPAAASDALTRKYACVACHQAAAKTVGPSWKEIGAKYADGKRTAAQLATSIKAGGSGKWGSIPMPAQAQVPDADAQSIAQWLLDGAK